MESEIISQAYRGDTHVKGQPYLYHPDIYIKPMEINEHISEYVDTCRGNAEVHKERNIQHIKERHESEHYAQDQGVNNNCEFSYLLL